MAGFFEDKEAVRFIPDYGVTDSKQRAKNWIEKQLKRYEEKRGGLQALFHKETNEFIGQCGLLIQEVDGPLVIEIGYHIFKKHWGQGYATEAAIAFKNYAFENNITSRLVSLINIENYASQRVAEKNGMTIEKQTRFLEQDIYIYSIKK
jgi:RimJ/RimL family protein N-acetyltransferase